MDKNNGDIIIKKDGKDLSADDMDKLGIAVYRTEPTKSQPKTFKEFTSALINLLESYDSLDEEDDDVIDDNELLSKSFSNDDDLLDELNKIYTPILITQELEGDISEQITEACSENNVLFERNIIKFDRETKFAQLVSVCALLIARKKNTQEYEIFKKSSETRKAMKLRIQKNEHAAATALAMKYLDKVKTTSVASVARKAADNLSSGN